ncbi:MAG TPA: hypothetical protein VGQ39_02775 [Pyrinomonadaceae bacterium]|nr:hypothetical protein [Pyrinomonadaceae bacterium]
MRGPDFKYRLLLITLVGIAASSCSTNDNAHTTAITQIAPPPHQVLTVINKPAAISITPPPLDETADPKKPLLIFHLQNGTKFRVGEEVPIAFAVQNAKLKADGGEFRVRYIVDDDDMKWLDTSNSFWLSGWIPGKHTVRIELIGPDGWPYKNGNANIVTREIEILI